MMHLVMLEDVGRHRMGSVQLGLHVLELLLERVKLISLVGTYDIGFHVLDIDMQFPELTFCTFKTLALRFLFCTYSLKFLAKDSKKAFRNLDGRKWCST